MIRLLFKQDRQTGYETWGSFFQSIAIDNPVAERLLEDGWTFQGIEHVPAASARENGEG